MTNHARIVPVLLGAAVLLGLHALPASATMLTRTFISNSGSDGNSCAANNPCATLFGAYNATAAGGEINILNGGDFGNLTIQKSITIRGEGNILGVTGGITELSVSAGATDVINLVGLDMLGADGSNNGIIISAAGIVNIADCQFHALGVAIYVVDPTTTTFLSVKDSLFQNNQYGVLVQSPTLQTKVLIDNVTVFGSGTSGGGAGIAVEGAHISAVVNNSTIANNQNGLQATLGASLFTYGNNRVNFNGDNGQSNQPVLTMK